MNIRLLVRRLGTAGLLLCGGGAAAMAQTGPRMVDTGRLDQVPARVETAPTRAPAEPAPAAPLIAAVRPFRLTAVQVTGAEAAPPGALEPAWRQVIGQEVGAAGLLALAQAIEARIEALGFALRQVRIPSQDFAGGVLRVEVVLGHLSEVTVGGDAAPAGSAFVQAQIARLTAERPLRQETLDRALALLARVPGLTVRSTVEPTTDLAALKLKLDLSWRPVDFGLGANNLGAVPLGRTQFDALLGVNGLLGGAGDRTEFIFAMPWDAQRFRYYGLTHARPIGDNGLTLRLSAGYLRTKESDTTTDGDATTYGIALSYPVILSPRRELSVDGSFDGINSESALLGFTLSNERTRALRGGVSFAEQTPGQGTSVLRLVVSRGLDIFGARTGSPFYGGPNFLKSVLQLFREQELPGPFVARLAGLGQLANSPLPASESLLFGGRPFGRGFPQASLQGDSGLLGSAELAVRIEALDVGPISRVEAYGFVDGGALWTLEAAQRGLPEYVSAVSTGAGLRATLASRVTGDVYVARGVAHDAPGLANEAWQVLFTLRSAFPGPLR
ncbi:ShlB/FhaC/HecB family hemolysin secretion/activation protein [Roseomonas terrae]|uniref:ShlB/FhaC/HecB family hemolysin secretion/activation protein n=1 Tax=Neoroseomonas terrae TaxID=424799 RepID=A0ABS5EMQ4_9PROT|nr:ShlB/FhaC/HecB family hemolysin secretion/activation protein [Neoroseomonas terrae]MBR0652308.1 ShlB/FhaC/HecB family hemolysin secretion/activation protein [Neoroseomonas terrae]